MSKEVSSTGLHNYYVMIACAGGEEVVQGPSAEWRDVWEESAFALERLQAAPELSAAEQEGLKYRCALRTSHRKLCAEPMHSHVLHKTPLWLESNI